MDADFWHQRWQSNQIAFHEGQANDLLVQYFRALYGGKERRIFLPLCGKTRDISWLMSEGYPVVGAELSEMAIKQLFQELEITPRRSEIGSLIHYSADGIDILVGDIFDVSADVLGRVDIIYDRAALVALPDNMRSRYGSHLDHITSLAPQFLLTFEYDQSLMDGPPFSVTEDEIRRCYGDQRNLKRIASVDVAGGLKGRCPATENLWMLTAEGSERR